MGKKASARGTSAPAEPIRILHLSDFHFSKDRRWDSDPVLRGLADTIAHLVEKGPAPDAVAITGDLADKGRAEDYEEARAWIQNHLLGALGKGFPKEHLLLVPGNHDVDRDKVDIASEALQQHLLAQADQHWELGADRGRRALDGGPEARLVRAQL